ncbi:hypothetical protein [Symbioplanes lichenis]|uniref:hypothetical protein n=1 Tax=Symbioplanes lichenis TaxID=1629072 RepID=UPI0027399AFE|nr:hypothetical protein [Actinoplanes lichenis]
MLEAIWNLAHLLEPSLSRTIALEDLAAVAAPPREWPPHGWDLGSERAVRTALRRLTRNPPRDLETDLSRLRDGRRLRSDPESLAPWLERFPEGPWIELFQVNELLTEVRVTEFVTVQLWNSRVLTTGPYTSDLLYAFTAVAETHIRNASGGGWHLHPVEKGRHLGYRLFFDARRTQQDLSWERHGAQGGLNKCPWGDPASDALGSKRSGDLHTACLAAVRRTHITGRGITFRTWAGRFGTPSQGKAFVAHPPVTAPTAW